MKNRSALKVIVVIFSDKLSLGIKEKRVSESKKTLSNSSKKVDEGDMIE